MEVSAGTGERFGRKDGSGNGISKEEALSSRGMQRLPETLPRQRTSVSGVGDILRLAH